MFMLFGDMFIWLFKRNHMHNTCSVYSGITFQDTAKKFRVLTTHLLDTIHDETRHMQVESTFPAFVEGVVGPSMWPSDWTMESGYVAHCICKTGGA